MQAKFYSRLGILTLLLSAMLLVPALAQTKESQETNFKARKMELIKELKLAPDKEKAIQTVEEKFAKERQGIIADLKKADADLKAALAVPKPDEVKVKELVSKITGGQDKLFTSFRNQRDEELALMTPLQQGRYLMALGEWRHEMAGKPKMKTGEKK